ncbi:cytochrome P450 [Mucidula mucida]|nr:cytochrome P450 [Mucidula mucida]
MLRHAKNVGDYEAAWYRNYGSVFRIAGVFNEPVLLVSDPKALQYVLQVSGYHFLKSLDTIRMIEAFFGHGLLAANDQDHQRQRKILNPAFSNVHLQCYLDVFQAAGSKLVQKLKEARKDGHKTENMLAWAQKVTLDIVGITSFRYSFGALDNRNSAFEEVLCHLFAEAQLFPSVADVLISQGVLRYLPGSLMPIMARMPTRENQRYQEFRKAMENIARTMYHRELQLVKDGIEEGKDIINILALASLSDDKRKRMTESEIAAQMGTFTFAGHDTTANTLAWLLYELSRHPEDQDKIRREISQVRPDTGVLTSSDYDAMPWLNASIKETLRLHPFAHTLVRVAGHNDVLPLLEPVTTRDGKVLKEIPIAKGQSIHISIYMYNRNPVVWGNDAHEWNPKRFLKDSHKEMGLGMYSNLCGRQVLHRMAFRNHGAPGSCGRAAERV